MSAEIVKLNAHDKSIVERLRAVPRTSTQLAMQLAEMQIPFKTMVAIAAVLDVSKGTIENARGVYRYGSPKVIDDVRSGRMTMNAAIMQLFPNQKRRHEERLARARGAESPGLKDLLDAVSPVDRVVHIAPALPSTAALTADTYEKIIRACEAINSLPRDEDVAALLSTRADRGSLRRALQRLGGINAHFDL